MSDSVPTWWIRKHIPIVGIVKSFKAFHHTEYTDILHIHLDYQYI